MKRSPVIILSSFILLVQGGLLWLNSPYYFTYYNPLVGGAAGTARLLTIGWGEGLNEAAAYLDAQPQAEDLQVAVCGYKRALNPFFRGHSPGYDSSTAKVMEADYLVYYQAYLQRDLCSDTWSFFRHHAVPVHQVTLQGVDYALIYRNPIQQRIHWQSGTASSDLIVLGYNVTERGALTFFSRQLKPGQPQMVAGLTPALSSRTYWITCVLDQDFVEDAKKADAILKSDCSLVNALPPGIYELSLGLKYEATTLPLTASDPALIFVDSEGHFKPITLPLALPQLAQQQLPSRATPLSLSFDNKVRVAGFQLNPSSWQSDSQAKLTLYYQLIEPLEPSLSKTFQLVLRLLPPKGTQPNLEAAFPVLPASLATAELRPGKLISVDYPLSLPANLSPGTYSLNVCLTVAVNRQDVSCLPLTVEID